MDIQAKLNRKLFGVSAESRTNDPINDFSPFDTVSLESSLITLTKAKGKVAAAAREAEQRINDWDSIRHFAATVESFKAEHGLDRGTAATLYAGLDNITRKYDLKSDEYAPTLECYGGKFSQIAATVTLESSILSKSKEFMLSVVSKLKDKLASLKEWWKALWDTGLNLQRKAKKVEAQLNNLKGMPKNKYLSSWIAADLAMADNGSIQNGIANAVAYASKIYREAIPAALTLQKNIADTEKAPTVEELKAVTNLFSVSVNLPGMTGSNTTFDKAAEYINAYATGRLSEDKVNAVLVPALNPIGRQPYAPSEKNLVVVSTVSELKSMVKQVQDIAMLMIDYNSKSKERWNEYVRQYNLFEAIANSYDRRETHDTTTDDDGNTHTTVTRTRTEGDALFDYFYAVDTSFDEIASNSQMWISHLAQKILYYVAQCAMQYEKGEAVYSEVFVQ